MSIFLIIFASVLIGAMTGIGGGIIIRPSLSLLGIAKGTASFLSMTAVFVMTVTNILTQQIWKAKINYVNLLFLASGSIVGAFLGAFSLQFIHPLVINISFILLLPLTALLVSNRDKIPPKPIEKNYIKFSVGLFIGVLSGILGIGGGVFMVTALLLIFGQEPKEAALQSVFIIMFTSAASLIQYGVNGYADFSISIYAVLGGILGGATGGLLSKYAKQKHIPTLIITVLLIVTIGQIYLLITGGAV